MKPLDAAWKRYTPDETAPWDLRRVTLPAGKTHDLGVLTKGDAPKK